MLEDKMTRILTTLPWVLIIIFLAVNAGGEQVTVQNLRKTPIAVCSNVASGPIILHPNEIKSLPEAYGPSFFLWACELGNSECINSQNPSATVAQFDIGTDSNSYMLSTIHGYNFAIRIMALSSTSCPIITCSGKLNDCPDELKILDGGAVIACKSPNSSDPAQLLSKYSSLVTESCQTPGSPYDNASTCPASVYLVVRFIESTS